MINSDMNKFEMRCICCVYFKYKSTSTFNSIYLPSLLLIKKKITYAVKNTFFYMSIVLTSYTTHLYDYKITTNNILKLSELRRFQLTCRVSKVR